MDKPPNLNTPYFSYTFLNEYTHDDIAVPEGFDKRLRDMLARFERKGLLKNTLLAVYGDHGHRLSEFGIYTEVGKFERNSPFLSIHMPIKFQVGLLKRYFM